MPTTTALNKFSSHVTQPKTQGASQAMLYATGMSDQDMDKAQVGIASVWFEGNPCNMHLLDLAEKVKQAVVGFGRASKEQLARTVAQMLNLPEPLPYDESDAVGLALCHAMTWIPE